MRREWEIQSQARGQVYSLHFSKASCKSLKSPSLGFPCVHAGNGVPPAALGSEAVLVSEPVLVPVSEVLFEYNRQSLCDFSLLRGV